MRHLCHSKTSCILFNTERSLTEQGVVERAMMSLCAHIQSETDFHQLKKNTCFMKWEVLSKCRRLHCIRREIVTGKLFLCVVQNIVVILRLPCSPRDVVWKASLAHSQDGLNDYEICSVHRAVHMTATDMHYLFQTHGSAGDRTGLRVNRECEQCLYSKH